MLLDENIYKYKRIKEIAKWSVGGTPSTSIKNAYEGDDLWATIADLKDREIYETKNKIDSKYLSKKIVKKGDLLFSFKLSIGKVAFAGNNMYTNEAICSFSKNSKIDLNYLFYAAPVYIVRNKKINIYGADLLNQDLIKNATILYPPKNVQKKIAIYLDNVTINIDNRLKKYNKKIELLKEYKEALIYETVTKGLDKNVEMKDSGIDYIGLCPKKWSIKRIKNFYKLGMGQTILKEDVLDEGLYPILSATEKDVVFGYLNKINIMLRENDMVIPARGNSIGFVKIISKESGCTQTTIYMKKNKNKHVLPKYVYYYLIGNKKFIFNYNNTAIPQITVNDINGKELLCPSIIEQNKIVDFLDKKTKEIDSEVEKLSKKIELIEELKESIIYECVTGKIDIEIEGEKYQKIIDSI